MAAVEKNSIKMIYLARQVGIDNQKNLVGNGQSRHQVEQTFINLQTALASVEAIMADIVKMNIDTVLEVLL